MRKLLLCFACLAAMMAAGTGLRAQEVTIPLWPGWTWISIPGTEPQDLATVLGSFTPMENDMIESQFDVALYVDGEWMGGLELLYPEYGYLYYSNRNVPVMLTMGKPLPQQEVTTAEPTGITAASAVVGSTVTIGEGNHLYARGACWGTEEMPTVEGSHTSGEAVAGSQNVTLTELTPSTTYHVRAYMVTDCGLAYGNEQSFTTRHEFVDLGLPSGTLWATCNVGANTPEEYGNYFAWGETQPKEIYNWSTYQYCNGSYNTLTKYCNQSDYGNNDFTDGLTILLPEDDAATANWGADWRMPTGEEWQELIDNTTCTWTTRNGVNGRLYTASNGNSLFLPAAGYRLDGSLYRVGTYGNYWSSSLYTEDPNFARNLYSHTSNYYMYNYYRFNGFPIRPVSSTSPTPTFIIDATANPAEGGEISGGGTYQTGVECTLTATANEGYTFSNWTENGEVVSANANYTFTVNADRTLVANFTLQSYTINVSANPTDGGSVLGGGNYNYGQTCIVSASANPGYIFSNWTQNDSVVSTGTTYTFTVNSNCDLVANFTEPYVDLGLPSGTLWAICNVGANAPEEYGDYFAWGETEPKSNFSSNYTYSANPLILPFEHDAATVNWGGNWRMPTKEEWQELYTNTTYIWTTQNGVNGRLFTASNGCSLFLPAAGYYNHYSGNSLSDAGSGGYYWSSSLCTDRPDYDCAWRYSFTLNSWGLYIIWRGSGQSVRPVRTQNTYYVINATANPVEGGEVSGVGYYQEETECTLTAIANGGYVFTNWTENGEVVSTDANYTFTVNANRTLMANFTMQTYMVSVSASPSNGGSVSGCGNFNYGQSCTVSAIANTGYIFANWTENGNVVSNNVNYTFTVDASRTLVANFSIPPTGAVNGLFTINYNGDQVYFSRGNLQYQASTNTWRFAENQYNYVGNSNSNASSTYSGWIDLFGWGTSGYNHGAVCYQPWSMSETNSDYYAYGQYTYNLYDQSGMADWGYNAISNGGNQPNQWRTLTEDEWNYIINYRQTSSGVRWVQARVNYVNGMILLPDDWSNSYYSFSFPNVNSTDWGYNPISSDTWNMLEQHGAVFLPASGSRWEEGEIGYILNLYWSASYYNDNQVYVLKFGNSTMGPSDRRDRFLGCAVRLVRNVE